MKTYLTVFLIILLLFTIQSNISAEKWEPFDFKGTENFHYLFQLYNDGNVSEEMHYIIGIKPTEDVNQSGDKIYEVSYTRKGYITESELADSISFGYWGFEMMGLFVNPMYYPMISDIDLEVGEKMSIYGVGIIKITGIENINGRDGYICELYTSNEDEQLMAVFVINTNIPVPLKATVYDSYGDINSMMTLVEYSD